MSISTPICNFGEKSHEFSLQSTEGKLVNLNDVKGELLRQLTNLKNQSKIDP